MILVLSGTRDGRGIVRFLKNNGFTVLATAVTDYGSELSKGAGADYVASGELDDKEMAGLIRQHNCTAVIDATHPFAAEASKNAMSACRELGVGYLRYEREPAAIPKNPLVHHVGNIEEAAKVASQLGNVIFYTAGSRGLELFLKQIKRKRVVVRVIPAEEVIKKCLVLGISTGDIIAMQGPFSTELNRAMMEECGSDVLVTKESGKVGGIEEKVRSALSLNIAVVVIERPKLNYPSVVNEEKDVIEWISKSL